MGMSPRLLRPRATGFNPKSISGLFGWWDASVTSSLTLSGNSVTAIADQSGNGRSAAQTVGINQPVTSTLGSKGAIAFAPQNSLLITASYTITAQSTFCVFRSDTTGGYNRIVVQESDAAATTYIPMLMPNVANSYVVGSFIGSGYRSQVAITQSAATIGESHHDGTAVTCYANGVAGSAYTASLNFSPTKMLFGNSSAGASGLTGRIGEVLVWNRALASTEITSVRKYLSSKWGITVS